MQNLEAKRKLVEVAQASSDYVFDDSQLARAKELINDIRTRLDVAAKLANADVNVQTEIALDDSAPADITDQVTQYFKLDGRTTQSISLLQSLPREMAPATRTVTPPPPSPPPTPPCLGRRPRRRAARWWWP